MDFLRGKTNFFVRIKFAKFIKIIILSLQYLMSGWWGSYSFRCQPVDYSNSPMALRVRFIFVNFNKHEDSESNLDCGARSRITMRVCVTYVNTIRSTITS